MVDCISIDLLFHYNLIVYHLAEVLKMDILMKNNKKCVSAIYRHYTDLATGDWFVICFFSHLKSLLTNQQYYFSIF